MEAVADCRDRSAGVSGTRRQPDSKSAPSRENELSKKLSAPHGQARVSCPFNFVLRKTLFGAIFIALTKMSHAKIKSKDLSYDSTLPPFLQRLHAQKSGRGDADRPERPLARAKKLKDPDDDDGPTMVNGSGETISRQEWEKLTKAASAEDSENVTGQTDLDAEPKASGALLATDGLTGSRADSSVTNGISQKKRKAAKVVGNDETGEERKKDHTSASSTAKKAKKKAKVKLTFNDDEGS